MASTHTETCTECDPDTHTMVIFDENGDDTLVTCPFCKGDGEAEFTTLDGLIKPTALI